MFVTLNKGSATSLKAKIILLVFERRIESAQRKKAPDNADVTPSPSDESSSRY